MQRLLMRILVLGAAAGGGFPQWNCNCPNCSGIRNGSLKATSRTQSSIAVSSDSRNWALINASPDILSQLKALPQLQPARKPRDTGIAGVVLVDSQIDHTLGLGMLREGDRLQVYCTASVYSDLTTVNPLFSILENYCGVDWHEIKPGGAGFQIAKVEAVEFAAVPVGGKPPPYSPHRQAPREDDNIALIITDVLSGQSLFYAPGLGAVNARVLQYLGRAACMLIDGTFWADDEMIRLNVGRRRAHEMGHLALSGESGMLQYLQRISGRKVLIHINNTNPILDEDSRERRQLESAGVEVAYDGMEIVL
jgi:pyrroloquinoline quinone biosynthesis protein B